MQAAEKINIFAILDEVATTFKLFPDSDETTPAVWRRNRELLLTDAAHAYNFLMRVRKEREDAFKYMRLASGDVLFELTISESDEDGRDAPPDGGDRMEQDEEEEPGRGPSGWASLPRWHRELVLDALLMVQASPPPSDGTPSFVKQMRNMQETADEYWREYSAITNYRKPYIVPPASSAMPKTSLFKSNAPYRPWQLYD